MTLVFVVPLVFTEVASLLRPSPSSAATTTTSSFAFGFEVTFLVLATALRKMLIEPPFCDRIARPSAARCWALQYVTRRDGGARLGLHE